MSEWQPIETAPRNRSIIISGQYPNGRAYVEEGHWDIRGYFAGRKTDPPTHWQPMPDPPGGQDMTNVTALSAK